MCLWDSKKLTFFPGSFLAYQHIFGNVFVIIEKQSERETDRKRELFGLPEKYGCDRKKRFSGGIKTEKAVLITLQNL